MRATRKELRCRLQECILDTDEKMIIKSLKESKCLSIYDRIKKRPELLFKSLELIRKKWTDEVLKISIKHGIYPCFFVDLHKPTWPQKRWNGNKRWVKTFNPKNSFKRFKIYGPSCVVKLHREMYKIGKELLQTRHYTLKGLDCKDSALYHV